MPSFRLSKSKTTNRAYNKNNDILSFFGSMIQLVCIDILNHSNCQLQRTLVNYQSIMKYDDTLWDEYIRQLKLNATVKNCKDAAFRIFHGERSKQPIFRRWNKAGQNTTLFVKYSNMHWLLLLCTNTSLLISIISHYQLFTVFNRRQNKLSLKD